MFSRSGKKPNKKSSVLSNQRPKRRGNDHSSRLTAILFLKIAAIIAVTVLVYTQVNSLIVGGQETLQQLKVALALPPSQWSIQVVDSEGNPLGEELRREVYKVASRVLRKGTTDELNRVNQELETLGILENIHVVRPQQGALVLSAAVRRPALLVQTGNKTRFLTAEGVVFGDVSDPSNLANGVRPNIIVTGIFETRTTPLQLDASQRLVVTAEERTLLVQAIALWKSASSQGLPLKAVTFQKFRGFGLTLEDEAEIVLGVAPFDYKIDKLMAILARLKKQGATAARIELDYDGKAFIKERKL